MTKGHIRLHLCYGEVVSDFLDLRSFGQLLSLFFILKIMQEVIEDFDIIKIACMIRIGIYKMFKFLLLFDFGTRTLL